MCNQSRKGIRYCRQPHPLRLNASEMGSRSGGVSWPQRIPGWTWLVRLWWVYAVVWIGLEGRLGQVVVMGVGATAVSTEYLLRQYTAGRFFSRRDWLWLLSGTGLTMGVSSALLTLVFMAVKTGLHHHGPEFSPAEIGWIVRQIPWWTAGGGLLGLGSGLLSLTAVNREP